MSENRQSYLSIVPRNENERDSTPTQLSLFPNTSDKMFFLTVSKSTYLGFADFIEALRPKWMLDFRPVPWFNFGNFTRKSIFALLDKNNVIYRDVYSSLKLDSRNDARIASGRVASLLNDLLPKGYKGPIVCLWDDPTLMALAARIIPEKLSTLTKQEWKVTVSDPSIPLSSRSVSIEPPILQTITSL